MRALVMGGSGFLGNNLTRKLLMENNEVISYDLRKNDFPPEHHGYHQVIGGMEDFDCLNKCIKSADVVFQLISTSIPASSNKNVIKDIEDNVINNVRIMEACLTYGVKKLVFPSSGGTVYGIPHNLPIKEDDPQEPICSYGISKVSTEKYLSLYHHLHGLDYTVLRIANPYGPYQNPGGQQGVMAVFLGKINSGETIHIWGDGSVVRDYIYVNDVVDAFYLASVVDSKYKVFNIGSGQGISLIDLVYTAARVIGIAPKIEFFPARMVDVKANVLDASRAKIELGWEQKTDLIEGISRSFDWIKTITR